MKFEDIDIKTITIDKSIKNSYDIKLNNKHIEFWTPELHVPFGLENKFNNYFINLEITDNVYAKLFEYFIELFYIVYFFIHIFWSTRNIIFHIFKS